MHTEQASIERGSLIGLLLVQLLVLLPLMPMLPSWLLALAALVWGWRFLLLQMRRGLPSRWVKGALVLGSLAAVFLHFGSFIRLEAIVTLLCLVYCLKLLEMRQRRDAQLVCALSFFVLGCVFLFDRAILITLYVFVCAGVLVAVLVGLTAGGRLPAREQAWTALGLMLKALPLMLLLFVLAPRMATLWMVPMASHEGRSGLSDEMAPGDIARLSQSDELVFRARFDGAIPPKSSLYWRALTLSYFDGRRWSRLDSQQLIGRYGVPLRAVLARGQQSPWIEKEAQGIGYELLLEPSGKPWLYSLVAPVQVDQPLLFTRDFNLQRPQNSLERTNYRIQSLPEARRDLRLANWLRQSSLQLPAGNPQSRGLAAELMQTSGGDPARFVDLALAHYRQQPFYYTLRPPRLQGETIDQFLFQSRRGFCAHYAGSMVFLLRAAGIPARIVAGYQGGEIDPAGFVQVRQFDAHAWVEAWLPGQGWTSVDPTAQVAPNRIELGLAEATQNEGSFLEERPFSPLRYQHLVWLNDMRRQWDRLEYRWQRWVVGFDRERQEGLLSGWLGDGAMLKAGALLVAGAAVCLFLYSALALWRQRVPRPLLERLFLRFCDRLARRGFERVPGETALQLVARIRQTEPELADRAGDFARLYTRLSFDPDCAPERGSIQLLRRYLAGL